MTPETNNVLTTDAPVVPKYGSPLVEYRGNVMGLRTAARLMTMEIATEGMEDWEIEEMEMLLEEDSM